MLNREVTIVIPSYKSRALLISKIKNFSDDYKIIVIENSEDKILSKMIKKKFKNNRIILKKNIGFGRAVNLGAKYVKTKFFFVINPDTKIYRNTIKNLLTAAKKIKNFGGLSPEQLANKKINNKKKFLETDKLYGAALFFKTKNFRKLKGFDENIFLYYEENDFFDRCKELNMKMYIIKNCFHYHTSIQSSSAIMENKKEKYYSYLLSGWHGQWSKFYYYKKYRGFFNALIICLPNVILNIIQLIVYTFLNPTKAKYKYYKVEGFLCSLIGMPSFKRSNFDQKNIY